MAVEFLIRLTDGPAGRNAGDIVTLKAVPNSGWGSDEGLPNYCVVRITDATYEQALPYYERHYKTVKANKNFEARSRYAVNVAALPVAAMAVGYCEMTIAQVIAGVKENNLVEKTRGR